MQAPPAPTTPAPTPPQRRPLLGDDLAYMLPMATFLAILWIGSLSKSLYAPMYVARTVIVAAMLWALRRHYTPIRWNGWWLGVVVGAAGIVQWVGMQLWLQHHFAWFRPGGEIFDPHQQFPTPAGFWAFTAVRIIGAVIVVPVMEELFWRDYLWRFVLAPNDFKLAAVGEWDWRAFAVVAGAFATVHGNWWLTAVGWAILVNALLVYTRSLGACIIAHAVTNLLLAAYVLKTGDWSFW
jgi:uncharacterized protein